MDDDAIATLMVELKEEGRDDVAARLKCWAHSHPAMGCFWSKTDAETCRRLCSDYLVSLVVNEDFQIRARLDLGAPVPMIIDPVPLYYKAENGLEQMEAFRREVEEKVKPSHDWPFPILDVDLFTRDIEGLSQVEIYCERCGNWHPGGECFFTAGSGTDEEDEKAMPDFEDCWDLPF
jgi:hypothetical protein